VIVLARAAHLDTVIPMWTRLVAGAAAHDINNLAQGLYNLLSLGSSPGASEETLTRYVSLAREGIKQLQELGRDLRTLADNDASQAPQRLDLLCAEALAELAPTLGRSVAVARPPEPVVVLGRGPALRMTIQAVVRYALSSSVADSQVLVRIAPDGAGVVVIVDAPTATPPRTQAEKTLKDLMDGDDQALASDAGLVLAGAALWTCGGEVRAAPGPEGGIRFKLCLRRPGSRASS